MKYKILIIMIGVMVFLSGFVTVGEASENIIGFYEKSQDKILFNNGVTDFELDTYKIKIGDNELEDKFICVENLKTLGYSMNWNPQKRETRFSQLKGAQGGPYIDEEEKESDQFQENEIQNISKKLSSSGPIYKSDVRIFINDEEVKTYNMGGYSFISIKELRRLNVDFFFEYGKINMDSSDNVYKIVGNKEKYGLVISEGIITVKPEYDEILIPEENRDYIFVEKNESYFVINRNGDVIKNIDIPNGRNSYMRKKKIFIYIYTSIDNSNKAHYTVLNSSGEKIFEGDFKAFSNIKFLDNNYLYVNDDVNSFIYHLLDDSIEKVLTLNKDIEVYEVDGEYVYFQNRIYNTKGYYSLSNPGIMNMNGEIMFPPSNYKEIYPFRGDYAVVYLENDRYSFINKDFTRTTNKNFEDVTSIHDGIAVFLGDGEYKGRSTATGIDGALFGIVDSEGNRMTYADYKMLKIYENNLIRFAKIDIERKVDEFGITRIKEDYDNLRYGVMDINRKVIIPMEYEKIEKIGEQFYCLKENTIYIYDVNGELISKKENLGDISFDKEFYYIKFWDDKKSIEDFPRWPNGDTLKLPEGINKFIEVYFSDNRSAYGYGHVKVLVTEKGLKIPTETYSRGMVAPPSDFYFPTYLWKE